MKKNKRYINNQYGFTVLDIVLVIFIILVLAAVIILMLPSVK